MQMNWELHRLAEGLESTRGFADEKQALRDEWAAETEGAVRGARWRTSRCRPASWRFAHERRWRRSARSTTRSRTTDRPGASWTIGSSGLM